MLAEVDIMMKLNHNRVLRCFGYQATDIDLIIFTEYMAAGSVRDAIRDNEAPLSQPIAVRYLRQAAEGLVYLHSQNDDLGNDSAVLHRDLKCMLKICLNHYGFEKAIQCC